MRKLWAIHKWCKDNYDPYERKKRLLPHPHSLKAIYNRSKNINIANFGRVIGEKIYDFGWGRIP